MPVRAVVEGLSDGEPVGTPPDCDERTPVSLGGDRATERLERTLAAET